MFCHNKTAFFVTFYVFRSNCFRTLAVILVSDLKEFILIITIIIIITYLFSSADVVENLHLDKSV